MALVFCETRKLAEEWTYRYLAAAWTHAQDEQGLTDPIAAAGSAGTRRDAAPSGEPRNADIRTWARAQGLTVSDRGRLRAEVVEGWQRAHPPPT